MRSWFKNAVAAVVFSVGVGNAVAGTISMQHTWPDGTLAANCSFSYPTQLPLSQPRTLIVDNNLPNGSVLYRWGYNEFAPDFMARCEQATTYNAVSNISNYLNDVFVYFELSVLDSSLLANEWLWSTSNPGIGLKLYVTVIAASAMDTGQVASGGNPPSKSTELGRLFIGSETAFRSDWHAYSSIAGQFSPMINPALPNYTYYYSGAAHHLIYSIRGELIKIGNVQPSIGLSVDSTTSFFFQLSEIRTGNGFYETRSSSEILGGGGITIVAPTCQLRTTDYLISLGRWVDAPSFVSLPVYGDAKSVGLNLECSGKLNNVYFSFQDTGASPLTNRNISVYDSIGGQYIDGLEIEMSYNGTRLNVHKMGEAITTYKTNSGTRGTVKTDPADLSYNSQSSAQFGARFVQRSAIKRGGVSYTGPVTGQVNMFVTYN
ncbi:hypothetical protein [Budvicia diplopodorum]|uniref:hypothetical protein n=1 Tax=Budvicia diplopodorum TaxID=1119056 RepID=UPI001358FF9F|nr:hypothetical protein [Budvicia diplopodorum]